jgi:hypothetical protein
MKRKKAREVKFRLISYNVLVSMLNEEWEQYCVERGIEPDPNQEDYQPRCIGDPPQS